MSISEQSNAEINQLRRNSLPAKPRTPDGCPDTCRVCGDGNAKMHYGVVTCFGCKGFFRRTLKRPTEYQCRHNGTCVVDRHERNSCRYCRFKKCIEVGMDPKAVRPDRDATGRHYQGRQRRSKLSADDEVEVDAEWMRKLPVDMRTTLMQLMNIDLMVGSGDGNIDGKTLYPLPITSIRQVLEDPAILDGKRTEMRYDSFREITQDELPAVAHRRLIAMIDWVDHLFDMMDIQGLDDKIALVKQGFAPLMVLSYSAITAKNTKQTDIICLCNFGHVKRECCKRWQEPYHFANRLAERSIDELIEPFRKMNLKDEEIALLKAIIILNPYLKTLSPEAAEAIADMRDRIQETLYHVVRETHPKEVASSRFGNLLLFIPNVMMLGTIVCENLMFIDSFGHMADRLMHDLLQETETKEDTLLNINNGLPPRRHSEPRMLHSASSSSIDSLSSYPSSSSYQENIQTMPYNFSNNSLPTSVNNFDVSINSAASMPNLDQIPECDPDYNVTLTPDMFSDMRQAMSVAHNMDTSMQQEPPSQQEPVPDSPKDRPSFYISTVESTKHKFTVTTSFDRYPNYSQVPLQGVQSNGVISQPYVAQQSLCKTSSLPPQYFQCEQQYSNHQSMEYEESYYQ
uniref:Nuclear receptor domain-containing protein n=1 Tax=Heterorhabditis bacteriophora TaxID=37862 RepID=A0A1I7XC71_HETBA